jgi:hypothetical protein
MKSGYNVWFSFQLTFQMPLQIQALFTSVNVYPSIKYLHTYDNFCSPITIQGFMKMASNNAVISTQPTVAYSSADCMCGKNKVYQLTFAKWTWYPESFL